MVQVWGHDVYQMTYTYQQYATYREVRNDYPYYFRKEFSKNFKRTYTKIENRGQTLIFSFQDFIIQKKIQKTRLHQ